MSTVVVPRLATKVVDQAVVVEVVVVVAIVEEIQETVEEKGKSYFKASF